MTIIRNAFDAGGYSLAEMTQAINILPNLYTCLGELGLFCFEGVTHPLDQDLGTADSGERAHRLPDRHHGHVHDLWRSGEPAGNRLYHRSAALCPPASRPETAPACQPASMARRTGSQDRQARRVSRPEGNRSRGGGGSADGARGRGCGERTGRRDSGAAGDGTSLPSPGYCRTRYGCRSRRRETHSSPASLRSSKWPNVSSTTETMRVRKNNFRPERDENTSFLCSGGGGNVSSNIQGVGKRTL